MGLKYLCNTWQGFLQQVVTLVGHGYHNYCLTVYPDSKQDRWLKIDDKLIKKYEADLGKDARYRRQKKGLGNYIFLRRESMAVIFRSTGDYVQRNDTFVDIAESPLIIQVGDTLRLKIVPIGSRGHCTVYIEKQVLRDFKAELFDHCRHRRVDILISRFQALNGIPAYSGITQQKSVLLSEILKEAKKHGLQLKRSDFPIQTRRKIYTVFE
jgi:hypothetical protein